MSETHSAAFAKLQRMGLIVGVALAAYLLWQPPMGGLTRPIQNLAAVTVLMATLWITQSVDIAVTSLIPLAAFPLPRASQ